MQQEALMATFRDGRVRITKAVVDKLKPVVNPGAIRVSFPA